MRLLLDTHTIIWHVENDSRLPNPIRQKIDDGSNEVYVSVISLWEISIKSRQRKLDWNRSLVDTVRILRDYGFYFLEVNLAHILQLDTLEQHHKDPFDRMLIAQAVAEDFALVGCDDAFDAYGVRRLW